MKIAKQWKYNVQVTCNLDLVEFLLGHATTTHVEGNSKIIKLKKNVEETLLIATSQAAENRDLQLQSLRI